MYLYNVWVRFGQMPLSGALLSSRNNCPGLSIKTLLVRNAGLWKWIRIRMDPYLFFLLDPYPGCLFQQQKNEKTLHFYTQVFKLDPDLL